MMNLQPENSRQEGRMDEQRISLVRFVAFPLLLSIAFLAGCSRKGPDRVIITAHRGASHLAPENTLVAFERAYESGADFAELDVHQTRDGEIILMHDSTLDRTTDGTGEVWDYTLDELKKLDAGSWFGKPFSGERVPTLREVMRLVKGKLKLNIEIKISREEPGIAGNVVDIIRSEGFERECIVTSFDTETVREIKRIAPDIRAGLIFGRDYPEDVFEGNWEILSCNQSVINQGFISRARESGKEIHVWTVNDEDRMQSLIALGVDSIITNRPGLLSEVLNK